MNSFVSRIWSAAIAARGSQLIPLPPRRPRARRVVWLALAASVATSGIQAADPSWSGASLGTLGGITSDAEAINSSGMIVGRSTTLDGAYHAFRYASGLMKDLGVLPGGRASAAHGINSSGQIVGECTDASGTVRAVLWSGGSVQALSIPGSAWSIAYAINDNSKIVGTYGRTGETRIRGFLWVQGKVTDLGSLGGKSTVPKAINIHGEIVGEALLSNQTPRAFLWKKGHLSNLGVLPGYTRSSAAGINDLGQIALTCSSDAFNSERPTLWSNGVLKDIGAEANGYSVAAINSLGHVLLTSADIIQIYNNGKLYTVGVGGWAAALDSKDTVVGTGDTGSDYEAFIWKKQ